MSRSPLLVFVICLGALSSVLAQDPNSQILAAAKELQAQQTLIAENETKIESNVVNLQETIHTVRIYTSRLGGAHKLPKK